MTSKRILMRLGKSPFETCSAIETFERNTIGRNNGNLIYGAAAHKLLSTEGVEVVPNYYRISAEYAEVANEEYDAFVLPLANAFRPAFQPELKRTTEFIKRLKIPFMMLSGGAQMTADGSFEELKPMEETVKEFARAVLDKSSALSVRGERTAEYLRSLGFNDVVVIGCPSMTMNGPGHRVEKNGKLELGSNIAYNIQTPHPFLGSLVERAEERFTATYFPQDRATLELMIAGTDPYRGEDERLPLSRYHRQFTDGVAEFHLDAATWIERMQDMSFSFGPRIHGNIAAILAGTPAVVVAHDARTLELTDYHEIPRVINDDSLDSIPVERLYEEADFSAFNTGHAERFNRISDFIHENGFRHIYDAGQEAALGKYEEHVLSLQYPLPQKTMEATLSPPLEELVSVTQLQSRTLAGVRKDTQQQSRTLATVQKELVDERARVERLEERVRFLLKAQEAANDRRIERRLVLLRDRAAVTKVGRALKIDRIKRRGR